MNYYGYGFGWLFPTIIWLFFIIFISSLFWGRRRRRWHDHFEEDKTPEEILADRFAKGEIDETEYKKRLDVLKKQK